MQAGPPEIDQLANLCKIVQSAKKRKGCAPQLTHQQHFNRKAIPLCGGNRLSSNTVTINRLKSEAERKESDYTHV